jgi:hypothetical protein
MVSFKAGNKWSVQNVSEIFKIARQLNVLAMSGKL